MNLHKIRDVYSNRHLILFLLYACMSTIAYGTETNWAETATVSASSERSGYAKDNANDGVVNDTSRWLAAEEDPSPWIELSFTGATTIRRIDIFSGWRSESALTDYKIRLWVDNAWQDKPEWEFHGTQDTVQRIYLDESQVIKLRIELLTASPGRIREIAVYDDPDVTGLPPAFPDGTGADRPYAIVDDNQHQIILNQVGYLTDRPKRFTAPLSADGAQFTIRIQDQTESLFQGLISGGRGDFTAFKPADSDSHYVIDLSGGALTSNTSDPFLIRQNLAQEQYWQTATDFLNDVRSVVGTHPSAFGGGAFRDGTYYDAIIPSLVLFYLSDPEFIDSMPRQIDWQADKARVTAPDFVYIQDGAASGVMDAVSDYYELEAPHPDAPDVVKLIHWGAGYILMRPNGRDPSARFDNDDSMIEPQTLEQVAYVLWAWPELQQWLPQSFYDKCRDFCFNFWDPAGGPTGNFTQGGSGSRKGSSPLDISPWWDPDTYSPIDDWQANHMHPFKGRHAPGHSIVPNLMMYEVALREERTDAAVYLAAALNQAEWIINNLDWNDPRTNKGHRLTEHRTIPNLVWLLQKYPQQAPAGLKAKITAWAENAVARADNLWDFRKFSNDLWTIPGMNEVGNSLSLPAIYTAASWVVDGQALKARLEELAFASVDHVFGRNPMLAAASSHPDQGFPEIERGWPKLYKEDTCARLETVRGNIATLPGSEMYPFQPGAAFRHLEGWANYGASWCISLSYLQFDAQGTTPDPAGLVTPPSTTIIAEYHFDTSESATSSVANVTASNFSAGAGIDSLAGHSPSGQNMFVRSSATDDTLSAAIAGDDYLSFTVTPEAGSRMNLSALVLNAGYTNSNGYTNKILTANLLTSIDGFTSSDLVSSISTSDTSVSGGSANYQYWVIDLSDERFQNITTALEFRVYVYDDTGDQNIIHRFDSVALNGTVTTQESLDWDGSSDSTWTNPDSTSWTGGTYNDGDEVSFGDTGAGTVTISGSVAPANVYVSASVDYSFTGDAISGSASLSKSGTGNLTLASANAYTGVTTVSGGTLTVGDNAALGEVAGHTLVSGGSLRMEGGISLAEPLTISGESNTAPALWNSAGSNTVTGPIMGGGRIQTESGTMTISGGISSSGDLTLVGDFVIDTNPISATGLLKFAGDGYDLGDPLHVAGRKIILNPITGSHDWTDMRLYFSSIVELGATDILPIGANLEFGWNTTLNSFSRLDLKSFDQTVGSIATSSQSLNVGGDVEIAGSGTLAINQSSDTEYQGRFSGALALVKSGPGTLTLNNLSGIPSSHSGATTVAAGTLNLRSDMSTSAIMVNGGASLELTLGSPVTSSALTLDPNATIKISGTPSLSSYTLITASSISGTPALAAPIAGYELVVNGNAIELNEMSDYTIWADSVSGLSDRDATLDFDGGSLETGLEYVLGSDPTDASDDLTVAPTCTYTAGGLELEFRRSELSNGDPSTSIVVEYGSDLSGWNPAVHNTDGVTIAVTEDFYTDGIDRVVVRLPNSLAFGSKLFVRVNVTTDP